MLDRLKEENEFIVIDAAPVLQTPDPLIIAKYCDKVVVVVKHEHTLMRDLRKSMKRFNYLDYDVNTIVLNQYK